MRRSGGVDFACRTPLRVILASFALWSRCDAELLQVGSAAAVAEDTSTNPVQRVTSVLEKLQEQVREDADREDKLHDKSMCNCKSNTDALKKAIADSKLRVPELKAAIEEAQASAAGLQSEIEGHHRDREGARKAIADAEAVKHNSKEQFEREEALTKTNLAQVERALEALQHRWAEENPGTPDPGSEGPAEVPFRLEAKDAFCGSHSDDVHRPDADPEECRTQCANNANCKGYATYEDSKCDKCVLYTANDCSDRHRQPTVCDGRVTAFSRELDASGTGTNTGIAALKETRETMQEDLRQIAFKAGGLEAQSEALYTAKQRDMNIADRLSQEKQVRASDLMLQVGSSQRDITDEEESVARDEKVLGELGEDCKAKEDDYHHLRTQISDELEALAETIKMLSDDDAQALFSKTFSGSASTPSSMFLQEGAFVTRWATGVPSDHGAPLHVQFEGLRLSSASGSAGVGQRRALRAVGDSARQPLSFIQWVSAPTALFAPPDQSVEGALRSLQQTASGAHPETPELSQLASRAVAAAAQHGHTGGFTKIVELINGMLVVVAKTQEDDDAKKEYCETEMQEEKGQKDMLSQEAQTNSAEIDSSNDQLAALKTELDGLHQAIAELDAATQQATDLRKEEKASANQAMSQTNAAIQLLGSAQDRLKGFYNRPAAPPGLRATDGEAISLKQQRLPPKSPFLTESSPFDDAQAQSQNTQQTLSAGGMTDTLQSLAVMGEVAQADGGAGAPFAPMGDLEPLATGVPSLDPLQLLSGGQSLTLPLQSQTPFYTQNVASISMATAQGGMSVASELQLPMQIGDAPSLAAPFFGTPMSFVQTGSATSSDDLGFLVEPETQTRGHGVMQMLAKVEDDLKSEFSELQTSEAHAKEAHDHLMSEYAAKKHDDVQATIEKTGARADLKESVQRLKGKNDGIDMELAQTEALLQNLHNECDWLLKNYDVRKQARATEAESMRRVQTVLEMHSR